MISPERPLTYDVAESCAPLCRFLDVPKQDGEARRMVSAGPDMSPHAVVA